jgi:hypothetical protein
MKVKELKETSFPDCSVNCEAVRYLGASECESACPFKFDKDGNYLQIDKGGKDESKSKIY